MSKFISLECDSNEVRVAVGSTGLTGVSIEKVLSTPIELSEGTQPWGSPQAAAALKELLQQANIKGGHAIACVSRNDIELRAITLPMVDTNELPDMVRFAAPRYFASVNESWPLDFITMPSHLEGSIDCIVGAISPALIQKIDATVTEAGLTLKHMVLRPMAAAAGALAKHPEWNNSTVLFIDLLNDEADVVITERGKAVFMRSFYAPTDLQDASAVKILAGEIKRTLMAAASQRAGLRVDQLIVWTKDSLAPLAQELSHSVDIPVKMLDPFTMAERADIAVAATTQTVGRFAPVLGALHLPSTSDRIIDFANPRKRVEKKKPVAQYILGGAAATALLAASWWWYSSSHSALDQDLKVLKDEIAGQTPILKTAGKHLADWKKVETFMQGDVLWVDELERLSVNAKDADTTYFSATTFNLDPRTNEPTILTKFLTKEKDLVPEIEAAYRDTKHNVRETGLAQSQDKKYPVAADMKITVATAEVKDPRNVKRTPIEDTPASEPKTEPNAEVSKEQETQGTEPAKTEPAKTEPATTQPATTEPTTTQPTTTQPATTQPATTEPATTEPATTEPAKPGPATTEPATTEPAKPAAEPILGGAS